MNKQVVKRVTALSLVVLMMIITVGCGGSGGSGGTAGSEGGDGGSQAVAAGSKLDEIIERGTLIAGVNPPGEPICFYDDQGNLIGYDVDWAKKLAETLGVDIEFVEVNGETRLSAVTTGRVDVIFANITGNLERAKSINFSMPYLKTGLKMLTKKGSPYKTIEDLNSPDVKVALAAGTTIEALVMEKAPNANLVYVESYMDQLLSLKEGKCDAIIEDGTSIDYAAGKDDTLEAQPTVYTSDPICIGYIKGDPEFARYLDMFVSHMISNGFQKDTYKLWFGSDYTGELSVIW